MASNIKDMISLYKSILEKTDTDKINLERYMAEHILIHICAKYEERYHEIVKEMVMKHTNKQLTRFIMNKIDIRNLKPKSISENILKRFSEEYHVKFQTTLANSAAVKNYHSIVVNRNRAAHGESISMTFDEIVNTYKSAEIVLDVFSDVLNSK